MFIAAWSSYSTGLWYPIAEWMRLVIESLDPCADTFVDLFMDTEGVAVVVLDFQRRPK